MTMEFQETAPGVFTASAIDARTKRAQNIAIIESCGAWQLFIDGEPRRQNLPSFRAAVEAAELILKPARPKLMVRTASVLVLLSVAGASAIGATKLISDETGAIGAPAPAVVSRFQPVKPVSQSAVAPHAARTQAVEPGHQQQTPKKISTLSDGIADTQEIPVDAVRSPYSATNNLLTRSRQEPRDAANNPADRTFEQSSKSQPAVKTEPEPKPAVDWAGAPRIQSMLRPADDIDTTEIASPTPLSIATVAARGPEADFADEGTGKQPFPPVPLRAPEGPAKRHDQPQVSRLPPAKTVDAEPQKARTSAKNRPAITRTAVTSGKATRRPKRATATPEEIGAKQTLGIHRRTKASSAKRRRIAHHRNRSNYVEHHQTRHRTVSARPLYEARRMVCIAHSCRFR